MKYIISAVLSLFIISCNTVDPNPVENIITEIPLIDAFIKPDHLQILRENRHGKPQVPIRFIYEEKEFDGLVEPQGAGSRYWPKWAYEIILDDEQIDGLSNFNLSAQVADETLIRTAVGSFFYEAAGFPIFYSKPVFLTLNNENEGLYIFTERIELPFFSKRNMPIYELVKTGFKSKFTFKEPNNVYENFSKEYPDNGDLTTLTEFIHSLDTTKSENLLEQSFLNIFDVENYLKYHAVTTVLASTDAFANNMFFYKPTAQSPFSIIPWDFDRIFDYDFKEIFIGENQIVEKLFTNQQIFLMYKNFMDFFIQNIYTENNINTLISIHAPKVKTAFQLDPYLGGSGLNFEKELEKLRSFMLERRRLIIDNWQMFQNPYN